MTLMDESIKHGEQARYLAAAAVKDLQHGRRWIAEAGMDTAAMERHLAYEKWDTAEIAWKARNECWAARARVEGCRG